MNINILKITSPIAVPIGTTTPRILIRTRLQRIRNKFRMVNISQVSNILRNPNNRRITTRKTLLMNKNRPINTMIINTSKNRLQHNSIHRNPTNRKRMQNTPRTSRISPILVFTPNRRINAIITLISIQFPHTTKNMNTTTPFTRRHMTTPVRVFTIRLPRLSLLQMKTARRSNQMQTKDNQTRSISHRLSTITTNSLNYFKLNQLMFQLRSKKFMLTNSIIRVSNRRIIYIARRCSLCSLCVHLSKVNFTQPRLTYFIVSLGKHVQGPVAVRTTTAACETVLPADSNA